MAANTSEPRSRLSLGAKIFLATALIVTLAVATAVALTNLLGKQLADRAVRDGLERSSRVQSSFQDGRLELLRLATRLVAGDPAFFANVTDTVDRGDAAALGDALEHRRSDLGAAFAIVLDAAGLLLAQAGELPTLDDDFSTEPLYLRALEQNDAAGLWAHGDRLFNAAAVPIAAGGLSRGFLITAELIDDAQADALGRVNATEVTFLLSPPGAAPARVATTLDAELADALVAAVIARPKLLDLAAGSAASRHLEVELRGKAWLARARPLTDAAGGTLGAAIFAASLEQQIEPYKRIGYIFAAIGLAAILLALLVSFLLPRRALAPISRLAAAVRAAAEGNYDQRIQAESDDEVGRLASAFSILLSELREKRDMEICVNELSRNLPETEASAGEAAPPEVAAATLLGLELRDSSSGASDADIATVNARQVLEGLSRDLRRISNAVHAHGGRVESMFGHRLVASFSGPIRCQQALSAAADVTGHQASSATTASLAAVMVVGPVVGGTVILDNRPQRAVAGWPVEQLEGLLRVARADTLLFSKAAHDELAQTLSQAGVTPQEHRSTVSSLPLFSLPTNAISTFSGPRDPATINLSSAEPTAMIASALSGIGPGSVLAERFEILSELGAGGMGAVYKARDRTLNQLVALKMLKQEMFGDGQLLDRLEHELQLARKISHANVLQTFDFGDADGFLFISMEYVRGITLRDLLDQSGSLPLSAGLRLARQLCRGLWAAHSLSVLHRDIKPENLIIEHNGNAKLMDFGIARPIQRSRVALTEPDALTGTPFYLAPEQLEGAEPDERADIYACGVVFYEIFTGNLPYPTDDNIVQVLQRKMSEEAKPPSEHWPTIPHTLEDIIMRCLQRDREQRFSDVETMLKELETLRA